MEEREAFENSFHYFLKAVDVLASPSEEQCERMGHYNVAWEIKDDVSAGANLIKSVGSGISSEEAAAIKALIEALKEIPVEVLSFTDIKEVSLKNMKHPSWAPLRKKANDLLLALASASTKNQQYFRGSGNELYAPRKTCGRSRYQHLLK